MENITRITVLAFGLLCAATGAFAYDGPVADNSAAGVMNVQDEKQQNLFVTNEANEGTPYRIPAVAVAKNGHIIAISDSRPCGNDIGYGEVDIKARISTDNGQTWGEEFFLADGMGDDNGGEVWRTGFGDAAVVADADRNEVLIMMVCGKTVCWRGVYTTDPATSNPNRVAQVRGTYDKKQGVWKWTKPVEVTETIYPLFVDKDNTVTVPSLFIGSGRICQSRVVKVGKYYRIYAATWTNNGGNRVIYSDDFGRSWNRLGTIDDRPATGGDEPKCEELPDGTVVLSTRVQGGRIFNFFTYSDVKKGEGEWGNATMSGADNHGTVAVENSTNGEIMILPVVRNSDRKPVYLALQSVPFGKGRANVGIYYKELASPDDCATPETFAANWNGKHQASHMGSAYSTMAMQADGKVAFLYEEETFGKGYTTVYKAYRIEDITAGKYTYSKKGNRKAFVGKKRK